MGPVRHPLPVACAGAVLAGGQGRRIGGEKAAVVVGGRTLLDRAVETVGRVARPVAVVARPETALPPPPAPVADSFGTDAGRFLSAGAPEVWLEPADAPRHPLTGVVYALEQAEGRAVLVCAVDLPLLDPATLRVILIAAALAPDAPAVVPRTGRHLQVLCALYRPEALDGLRGFDPDARAIDVVEALGPAIVPFDDDTPFTNVNRPEDVTAAERLLKVSRR
ncbi:Molybdenum cofactor guanylyltransferase [Paraconexibacter sp. AEG42_29]|uniref:Molybdenum cofactor guanylyltransferase n=1 Tax=Paraconexibacter sp. AEG42_29 TaxID=2997339 RepID=A0AAU7ATD9_9ACTN